MKNMNSVIRIYYQQVSPRNVLEGRLDYHRFSQKDFEALSLGNMKKLSETDVRELYQFLEEDVDAQSGESGLNVFRTLKKLAAAYLFVRDDQPICRYDMLLQWRELTGWIGEDVPICAFLAYRTEQGQARWDDFEWKVVIGHDNMQLNRLMQRGISDNHFHLFGSAPAFKLIWIKLMNDLLESKYSQALAHMEENRRVTRRNYASGYREDSLEKMCLQAALIRAALFYFIFEEKCGVSRTENSIVKAKHKIQSFLVGNFPVGLYKGRIQIFIDKIRMLERMRGERTTDDYANWRYEYDAKSINHDFEGERGLLYQMFLGQINGRRIPEYLMQWFYAYLAIQIKLREELVQVNDNVGFENFDTYNNRKSAFLFTVQDKRKMARHAVLGSMEGENIQSLELRVTPQKTVKGNRDFIRICDSSLKGKLSEEMLKNIYYVYHFPKRQDDVLRRKNGFTEQYRHYRYRTELERSAAELVRFREQDPETAARVLGIDACAQEIGCRPEVLAPVFRKLTGHVAKNSRIRKVRQWKATYHVGEDFRDIVDGLRAVDEAVLFLNMQNGDRLGHATVLGINAGKWYESKEYSIRLPKQDYLDNVVWLYHKLVEFDICGVENLKGFLKSEYEKYFREIYPLRQMEKYDIDMYYEAWKLRGDHPLLYSAGKFSDSYHFFREHWRNDALPEGSRIRGRQEAVELIYYYHYSADVRSLGNQPEIKAVPKLYIEGTEKVQRAMQNYIAERGICIEANPSSNFLISTMEHYHEHPIVNLFNLGLTLDAKEISGCAQLHVSINTDDKGVFRTALENEYALMGCALESLRDEQGRKMYQKQMVYQWLDNIRKNGNQQSFLPKIKD